MTVVRPVTGWPISQCWGQLEGLPWGTVNPGGVGGHPGTDYACPDGTEVVAVADGLVLYEGAASGFGDNLVSIWHPQYGVTSRYGHMGTHAVLTGQQVVAGQPIGLSNNEGASTGPHLHFEIGTTQAIDAGNPPNIDSEAWLQKMLLLPTEQDWFDMATQDDLKAVVDASNAAMLKQLPAVITTAVTAALNQVVAGGQKTFHDTILAQYAMVQKLYAKLAK